MKTLKPLTLFISVVASSGTLAFSPLPTPTPTPPPIPSDLYQVPEFITGVTQPENGKIYRHNNRCWQAKNSPTTWEPVLEGWFWAPVQCFVPQPSCLPMAIPTPLPDMPVLVVDDYAGGEYEITGYVESLAGYAGVSVDKVIVYPANDGQRVIERDGRFYLVGSGRANLVARISVSHATPGCTGFSYNIGGAVQLDPLVCLDVDKPKPYKRVDAMTIQPGESLDARALLLMSYGAPVVFEPELLYNLQVKPIGGDVTIDSIGADYHISGNGKVRITGEYDLDLGGPSCGSYHVTGGSLDLTIVTESTAIPSGLPIPTMMPSTPTPLCLPLAPREPKQIVDQLVLPVGEPISLKEQLMRAYYTPADPRLAPQSIINAAVMTYEGEIIPLDTPEDDLQFIGEGRVRMVGTYELSTGDGCTVFQNNRGSVELTIIRE